MNRRLLTSTLALASGAVTVAGCAASTSGSAPKRAVFTYSAHFATSFRPGQTVVIRWVPSTTATSSSRSALPVTLAASIDGPFNDAAQAKSSRNAGTGDLAATPITTSAYVGRARASRITIPLGTKAGYYNLVTTVRESGGTATGMSIVRVVTP